MNNSVMNPVKAFTLVALSLAIAAMGIYVANADDAPGAAVMGMLLMAIGIVHANTSSLALRGRVRGTDAMIAKVRILPGRITETQAGTASSEALDELEIALRAVHHREPATSRIEQRPASSVRHTSDSCASR